MRQYTFWTSGGSSVSGRPLGSDLVNGFQSSRALRGESSANSGPGVNGTILMCGMRRGTMSQGSASLVLAILFLFGTSGVNGQDIAPVGELKKVPKIDPVGQLAPVANEPIASFRPLTNGPYVVFYNRKVVNAGSWEWTPYTYPTEEAARKAAAEYQTRAGLDSRAIYQKIDAKKWQTDRAAVVKGMRSTLAKVSETQRVAKGITISSPTFYDVPRSTPADADQRQPAVTGAAKGTLKGASAGTTDAGTRLEGTRWGAPNLAPTDTIFDLKANGVAVSLYPNGAVQEGRFGNGTWTKEGNIVSVKFVDLEDGSMYEWRGTLSENRFFPRIFRDGKDFGPVEPYQRYP
jgi:hypothetical protein